MTALVVSDSSPLMALLNIGQLCLLEKLFTHIIIPPMVAEEIGRGENDESPWFVLRQSGFIQDRNLQTDPRLAILLLQIDPGESEAILLADQLKLPLLIDDRAGRRMAREMGLKITGLVGVLEALKRKGMISAIQMTEIVVALEIADFRLSTDLKKRLLEG